MVALGLIATIVGVLLVTSITSTVLIVQQVTSNSGGMAPIPPTFVDTTTTPTTTAPTTAAPTTSFPTPYPTNFPTEPVPTALPTQLDPTAFPTRQPTNNPSPPPSGPPTPPTQLPTREPTNQPTNDPTAEPTQNPTAEPTTPEPTTSSPTSSVQPNIFLALFDDVGNGMIDTPQGRSLGLYDHNNNARIHTPQLYNIASKGMFVNRFYATSPVCMPSRYTLLTGIRLGTRRSRIRGNPGDGSLQPFITSATGEILIPRMLKQMGYRSAMFGKAHFRDHPSVMGFDYALWKSWFPHADVVGATQTKDYPRYFSETMFEDTGSGTTLISRFAGQNLGINIDNYGDETNKCSLQGDKCVYSPDVYHNETLKWMKNHLTVYPTKPFFVYRSFLIAHDGRFSSRTNGVSMAIPRVNGPIIDYSTNNPKYSGYFPLLRNVASSMTNYADRYMGDYLNFFNQEGIAENTFLVVLSDNGGTTSFANTHKSANVWQKNRMLYDATGPKINYPYRAEKRSLLLGGVAVPCIMHWPSRIKPNSVLTKPVEMPDISKTILSVAGYSDSNTVYREQFNGIDLSVEIFGTNPVVQNNRPYAYFELCHVTNWNKCEILIELTDQADPSCLGKRVHWTIWPSVSDLDKTIEQAQNGWTQERIGARNLTASDFAGYTPITLDVRTKLFEDTNYAAGNSACIAKAQNHLINHRIV